MANEISISTSVVVNNDGLTFAYRPAPKSITQAERSLISGTLELDSMSIEQIDISNITTPGQCVLANVGSATIHVGPYQISGGVDRWISIPPDEDARFPLSSSAEIWVEAEGTTTLYYAVLGK